MSHAARIGFSTVPTARTTASQAGTPLPLGAASPAQVPPHSRTVAVSVGGCLYRGPVSNEMDGRSVGCASCDEVLPAVETTVAFEDRQPCPNCGSRDRNMVVGVGDEAAIRDWTRVQQKRPGVKRYLLDATMDKPGVQRSTGRPNRLTRIFDKSTNSYEEIVTDEETGKVLHRQSHPLTQHKGHGSDKGPRMSPPPQVSTPESTTRRT